MEKETELLTWIGPKGHVSPVFKALIPGRTYAVPVEVVAAFLASADCWARPANAPAPEEGDE